MKVLRVKLKSFFNFIIQIVWLSALIVSDWPLAVVSVHFLVVIMFCKDILLTDVCVLANIYNVVLIPNLIRISNNRRTIITQSALICP